MCTVTDPIFVMCQPCEGSGRHIERENYFDRDGGWFTSERDLGECQYCHGTGDQEIEGERLTIEDLEQPHE